jgi:hypothetical protein
MPPAHGSEVYSDFIREELADQRASKTSLEQRAAGVVTTSGVLVALLFGLTGLVSGPSDSAIPERAELWLFLSLGGFALASALALFVVVPHRYRGPTRAGLEKVRRERWDDVTGSALSKVSATRIVMLASYRKANGVKAWLLVAAIGIEVLAIATLAVAVALVIAAR